MKPDDQWTNPPDGFTHVLFDKTDAATNAHRYYLVGWFPTLFADGAVVLCWSRKGMSQRVWVLSYPSLQVARPAVRAVVRARIRHGYQVWGGGSAGCVMSSEGGGHNTAPCGRDPGGHAGWVTRPARNVSRLSGNSLDIGTILVIMK